MDNRFKLQTALEWVLGTRQVYFQKPTSVLMQYPAIVYTRSRIAGEHADNMLYFGRLGYTVTLIDKNPDSLYFDKLVEFPFSQFDRQYVVDNLNHFVFTIYF